jgi:hypothetical protein
MSNGNEEFRVFRLDLIEPPQLDPTAHHLRTLQKAKDYINNTPGNFIIISDEVIGGQKVAKVIAHKWE